MTAFELLQRKRAVIIKKWFNAIIAEYPPDTALFLKKERDQFNNPVGQAIRSDIEEFFDEFLEDESSEKGRSLLDRVIRIRAVQDFSPGDAVAFVFTLKEIIRTEIGPDLKKSKQIEQLLSLESKIDRMALFAFQVYMDCRERVYQIKANELKRMSNRIYERYNQLLGAGDRDPQADVDPKEFVS